LQKNEYCPNCGEKTIEGAFFCDKCGARLYSPYSSPSAEIPKGEHFEQRWGRRRARRRYSNPLWGVLSFFGFLIILALTFSAYPDLLSRIAAYFNELSTLGRLVLPAEALGLPLIYFLNLSGVFQVALGAIRVADSRDTASGITDIVSGAFALYLAHLFTEFYSSIIAGDILVFYFVIGLAGLVVIDAIVWAIPWYHDRKTDTP
jgi:hypothetical protein